jgi:hypothetical protein
MYANVAAGTLIVLGAVIAVLFSLGASLPMVALGLAAIAAGGLISAVARRTDPRA